MINIADRLKAAGRPAECTTDSGAAPDPERAKTESGASVRGYPAKNLVLENGQYRAVDQDK